jgi:hypothetical protein
MQTRKWTEWTSWLVLPAVFLFVGTVTGAAENGRRVPNRAVWVHQVTVPGEQGYWIGIMGGSIDPLLKKHLQIDAGVVVQHVVPDSPANKAGIQEDDILLKFGDEKVADVRRLAEIISGNEGKEAKVTLVREGQEQTVAVTPEKRPDTVPMPPLPQATDWKKFKEWMEKLQKGETGEDPLRMRFMHPGIVMPKEWEDWSSPPFRPHRFHLVLPKNTSITITKEEEGPAKIVVKKDDKTWEVTEDKLDELPEEVRQIVSGVLGRGVRFLIPGAGDFRFEWDGQRFGRPIRPLPKRGPDAEDGGDEEPGGAVADDQLDAVLKKLDEMNQRFRQREQEMQREMERLRKEVESLKKKEV